GGGRRAGRSWAGGRGGKVRGWGSLYCEKLELRRVARSTRPAIRIRRPGPVTRCMRAEDCEDGRVVEVELEDVGVLRNPAMAGESPTRYRRADRRPARSFPAPEAHPSPD